MRGSASGAVPCDRCLALVRNTYCDRIEGALGQQRAQLEESCLDEVPDLGGVVLHQPRGGEVLGQFAMTRGHHLAVLVEGERPHSRSAGIDGNDHCHRGTVASWRSDLHQGRLRLQADGNLRERPVSREDAACRPLTRQ